MIGEKVKLRDICELKYGRSLAKNVREPGKFSVYGSNGAVGTHVEGFTQGQTIVVGRKGSIGEVAFSKGPCWPIDTTYFVDESATEQYPRWLYYALGSLGLTGLNKSAAIPGLNRNDAYEQELWLPPLEEQKRIAGILDQAAELCHLRTRALDKLNTLGQAIFHEMFAAEAGPVIAKKSQLIRDFCEVSSGSTPSRANTAFYQGEIPWVKTGEVNGRVITDTEEKITDEAIIAARLKVYPPETVLVAMYGQGKTRGQVGILGQPAATNQACAALLAGDGLHPRFLYQQLLVSYDRLRDQGRGGNQPNLNAGMIQDFPIYVPDFPRQQEFVEKIEVLERQIAQAHLNKEYVNSLFASLQHRAFRGEL